jgi:DNA (cytosine-5)-methyltransferase 1
MQLRALDLFCGAGGASMGLHRAGFDVTGVDIKPQPRYPFTFVQADAMEYPLDGFDFIWASPPCQAHTSLKVMHNARIHADMIPATRAMLQASGIPYVMENVVGAPIDDTFYLCGTMFNLGVDVYDGWRELRRHRVFEASFIVLVTECVHKGPTIGFYGDHARDRRRKPGVRDRGVDFPDKDKLQLGRDAMDMPWADWRGISQAIPPAYSEFIGKQAIQYLEQIESSRSAAH